MPLVGSILIVGGMRASGGFIVCNRCHAEVNRTWTLQCAFYGHDGVSHEICAACLTAIQRFARADPDAALARLHTAAERATPKPQ